MTLLDWKMERRLSLIFIAVKRYKYVVFMKYVPVSDTGPRSQLTQLPSSAAVRNALLGPAYSVQT